MGRRITSDVFTAWDHIFRRPVTDKRVVLDINADDPGGTYIEFRIEDADGYFYVRDRSLGFRWFFVFLLLTKYRGLRSNSPGNLVYLFDEPASNLHASAQGQLLASLERLSETCVILYTTHSHHLINPDWLENTYVVRNRGIEIDGDVTDYNAQKTDIALERYRSFAAGHPDQSHYFQPILDMLDYQPSKLEMVTEVVMTEGKNDYYCLRYMHDVVLQLGLDLHLMPGGGAGSLDKLISIYLGWSKNFVVLLDSDRQGVAEKKRYLDRFGPILSSRIFTLGDLQADLKGKSIESAFDAADRTLIQAFAFPGDRYTKKKFWRSLQQALVGRSSVKLTEPSETRFSDLLKSLATKLDENREVGT